MAFSPSSGARLSANSDVVLNGPVDGQILIYDAATQKWKNSAAPSVSLSASKDALSSGAKTLTAGSSSNITKFSGSFTADRTVTLATAASNSYFELSFIDTTFNGFSVTITDGVFNHVFSYPTYVKYVCISGVWERVL